jgi:hypothetical protein
MKNKKNNFKQYMVQLRAAGNLKGSAFITAESEEEAEALAIAEAESGDVHWHYDGCNDGTIEVSSVTAQ